MNRLHKKFHDVLRGKRVIYLHIPDDFEFMDPDLLDELRAKLPAYVTLPGESRHI